MSNGRRSPGARRRIAVTGAILITMALTMTGLVAVGFAAADERDDAVKRRDQSQSRIDSLEDELEGIDEDLAALYIAMEQTRIDVANTQIELADAEDTLAAAERRYQQLVDELADAKKLKADLEDQIEESKVRESELTRAVADMARDLYRGDSVTPLSVVVNMDDLGDISDRAAAATSLSRAQSRAMDEVRTGIVITENQAEKQKAVTERIADLEAKAKVAFDEAKVAKQAVEDNLASLQAKQSQQMSAETAWEARRSQAQTQLESANTELQDAAAAIVKIDRERAAAEKAAAAKKAAEEKKKAEAEKKKQEQAGGSSSGSGGSSSSSGSSSGGSSSSSGALFANPFKFQAPITSSFGMRLHPILGYYRLHGGTDFGAACGTRQYATRAGTVAQTGYNSEAGNYVMINHGIIGGVSYITQHSHLSSISVSRGQSVTRNTSIGKTGTTGMSTGCHLHLVLYRDGVLSDIVRYM